MKRYDYSLRALSADCMEREVDVYMESGGADMFYASRGTGAAHHSKS